MIKNTVVIKKTIVRFFSSTTETDETFAIMEKKMNKYKIKY